jgi:methanogenic corrinoid protein MtbC1
MVDSGSDGATETTYPLGAASRRTGLSAEVLRAWERRYGAVHPPRTPGGTRRYRAEDLERLRLLKAAVDAGNRIGDVANLQDAELAQRIDRKRETGNDYIKQVFVALIKFDAAEIQRLLAIQLSALGPVRFASEYAMPLMREIGDRWANGSMSIASEHLATSILHAMLGSALQPSVSSLMGPRIVFATLSGDRHEIGLQMAALTAMGAGAAPVYLGSELPIEELLLAIERTNASALALSVVAINVADATRTIGALRNGIPADVHCWIGGAGAPNLPPIDGVEWIESLGALESRVVRLGFEKG